MRRWPVLLLSLLVACAEKPVQQAVTPPAATPAAGNAVPSPDTTPAAGADTATHAAYQPAQVRLPDGIYQGLLPTGKSGNTLHTVAFAPGTFRLQEEDASNPDSPHVVTGTWAPSQGGIWLYKDHLVWARYAWQGDTLRYYSPRWKRHYSLQKMTPVTDNKTWRDRRTGGTLLFGTGTEPFWSVEIGRGDSLVLNMPDWAQPLRTKVTATREAGKWLYASAADSLTLMVHPHFCNDGMSDFIYTRKLVLTHQGKTYKGCGELFR